MKSRLSSTEESSPNTALIVVTSGCMSPTQTSPSEGKLGIVDAGVQALHIWAAGSLEKIFTVLGEEALAGKTAAAGITAAGTPADPGAYSALRCYNVVIARMGRGHYIPRDPDLSILRPQAESFLKNFGSRFTVYL